MSKQRLIDVIRLLRHTDPGTQEYACLSIERQELRTTLHWRDIVDAENEARAQFHLLRGLPKR